MRRRTLHAIISAAAVALVCCAGCGRVYLAGSSSHYPEAAARVSLGLLADDDIAPDLIPRLIRPEPEPLPVSEAPRRRNRVGVRGAYFMPQAAVNGEWDDTFLFGAYYRYEGGMVYEFAVDMVTIDGAYPGTAGVASEVIIGRFDVLMAGWGSSNEGTRFYFLLGGALGLEDSTWLGADVNESRVAGLIDAGLGIGAWNGAWDARVGYTVPAVESNIDGFLSIGVGFAF